MSDRPWRWIATAYVKSPGRDPCEIWMVLHSKPHRRFIMDRRKVLSVTMADCELQTFRSGGKGGQNQNTRDTGVRIIHRESGARGEARDERSQWQNRKLAWRRMYESKEFQLWLRRTLGQRAAVEAEASRYEEIPDSDLKVEVRRQGRWVQIDPESIAYS